jgi:hypothetical protein
MTTNFQKEILLTLIIEFQTENYEIFMKCLYEVRDRIFERF